MISLSGCRDVDPVEQRDQDLSGTKVSVKVGVISDVNKNNLELVKGMKLRLELLNQSNSKGRQEFHIQNQVSNASGQEALKFCQGLVKQPSAGAAITKLHKAGMPSAVLLEYFGLIHLSVSSSQPDIMNLGLTRIFRIVPNDKTEVKMLAAICQQKGIKNVAIYQINNEYGRRLANVFEKAAPKKGIKVIDRRKYDNYSQAYHYTQTIKDWKEYYRVEAILVLGQPDQVAPFLRMVRQKGLQATILGTSTLDSPLIINSLNQDNIIVCTAYNPQAQNSEIKKFVATYSKRHGSLPGSQAAIGFDSMGLLTWAINKSGSAAPGDIARIFQKNIYKGVTGRISFNQKGEREPLALVFKQIDHGQTKYFEVKIP
jgi:branched-chain amino acid transport system substrate-binding protein